MKKLIALLLAMVMVFGLVACAGNDAPAADAPAADTLLFARQNDQDSNQCEHHSSHLGLCLPCWNVAIAHACDNSMHRSPLRTYP